MSCAFLESILEYKKTHKIKYKKIYKKKIEIQIVQANQECLNLYSYTKRHLNLTGSIIINIKVTKQRIEKVYSISNYYKE